MDFQRFDELTTQLRTGQIGRRRFLMSAIALGIGLPHVTEALAARSGELDDAPAFTTQGQTTPYNPFDWFCWPGPGPFIPWFPVVPDADAVRGTRVRMYGLHLGEGDLMTMAAFGNDNQELSRCETSRDPDGSIRLRFSDGVTEIEGRILVERDAAGSVHVTGELGGDLLDTDAEAFPAEREDPAQSELLNDWVPLEHEVRGLLDVLSTVGDDTATAGGAKCAAAGYLAGFNCLVPRWLAWAVRDFVMCG